MKDTRQNLRKALALGLGCLALFEFECFAQFVGDLSRVPSLPNTGIKILKFQVRSIHLETRQLVLYDQKNREEYTLKLTVSSKLKSARNLGFKHALTLEDLGPGCGVRVSFHPSTFEIGELILVTRASERIASDDDPVTTNAGPAKDKRASTQGSTLRVDVNLAMVGVRVTDRNGKEVSGLSKADFLLFEDDVPQPIAMFSSQEEPVSLAVMLDRSLSMGEDGRFERAKAAAVSLIGLVKSMNQQSEFLYLGFHSEVGPIVGFEGDEGRVRFAIKNTLLERSGTSLYDAMIQALDLMKKASHKRQALVVFTDGADQHSRFRLEELIEAVQASQAQVFAIGCFRPEEDALFKHSGERLTLISGKGVDNPRRVFKRLAEESGAEYFFPQKSSGVSQAAQSISHHLRRQYTLAYYPTRAENNGYRRIRVTVNSKAGLRITARHGLRLGDEGLTGSTRQPPGRVVSRLQEVLAQPSPFESKVRVKENGLREYREDFSDPSSGWPQEKSTFYEQNSYHIVEAEKVVASGPWFKDFQAFVTVELKKGLWQFNSPDEMSIIRASNIDGKGYEGMIGPRLATMGGGPGAGLVFRLNENGYYALLLSGLPKGKKSFAKLVRKDIRRDKLVDLIPWTEVRDSVNPPGQKRIGVSCNGDTMKLYLGKNLIGTFRDDTLADGMVGLVLTGEGYAVFSDLVVEGSGLPQTISKPTAQTE